MRFVFVFVSLDPEQKDQLIEVIEKLLADKTTVSLKWFITFKGSEYYCQLLKKIY